VQQEARLIDSVVKEVLCAGGSQLIQKWSGYQKGRNTLVIFVSIGLRMRQTRFSPNTWTLHRTVSRSDRGSISLNRRSVESSRLWDVSHKILIGSHVPSDGWTGRTRCRTMHFWQWIESKRAWCRKNPPFCV
jgi:hypothetical protein